MHSGQAEVCPCCCQPASSRIEPDSERHWLNAQFALGSLYNKLQPTLGYAGTQPAAVLAANPSPLTVSHKQLSCFGRSAGMANLDTNVFKQSIRHSRNVAEYVKKHGVLDFK